MTARRVCCSFGRHCAMDRCIASHWDDCYAIYNRFMKVAPERRQLYADFVREIYAANFKRPRAVFSGITEFPNLRSMKFYLFDPKVIFMPMTVAPNLSVLDLDCG